MKGYSLPVPTGLQQARLSRMPLLRASPVTPDSGTEAGELGGICYQKE